MPAGVKCYDDDDDYIIAAGIVKCMRKTNSLVRATTFPQGAHFAVTGATCVLCPGRGRGVCVILCILMTLPRVQMAISN